MSTLIRQFSEDHKDYLRDESRSVGHAEHIAFPCTENEVREVLAECYGRNERITVQGARTGLAAAAVPDGGLILNLSKMDRVTGMRRVGGSYHLVLQPGVVLAEVKKMLASKRFDTVGWDEESLSAYAEFCRDGEFFFSPDPTETSATIGGMTACNASGARTYKYGPIRGYVEAVRMALADGRMLSARRGGERACGYEAVFTADDGTALRVPVPTYRMPHTKNASGYYACEDMELIDLLIGSDGTLGVMTEIEVTLLPLPRVIWGVSCLFTSEEQSLDFVEELRGASNVASVEFFDSGSLEVLRTQKQRSTAFSALPDISPEINTLIYVELHCDDEAQAAERLFAIGDMFTKSGGSEDRTWVARDQSDLDRLMFFRHAVPESVNMLIDRRRQTDPAITKLGADMSVPDEQLRRVMELYRRTLAENGLQSATWGHVGNNHLHVNVLPENMDDYRKAKELFRTWAAEVTAMGGAVSAEHGVGKLKAAFLTIMYGEEHIEEMRRMKYAFDPKGLLGVGNLFSPAEVTL